MFVYCKKNPTRHQVVYCSNAPITLSVVTGVHTKFDFTAIPQTSLLGLKGPTSKGRGERKEKENYKEGIKETRRREREKGEAKGEK